MRAAYSYAMIASVAGDRESESAETQLTDSRRRIDCSVLIGIHYHIVIYINVICINVIIFYEMVKVLVSIVNT